jgi:hypothetical protein
MRMTLPRILAALILAAAVATSPTVAAAEVVEPTPAPSMTKAPHPAPTSAATFTPAPAPSMTKAPRPEPTSTATFTTPAATPAAPTVTELAETGPDLLWGAVGAGLLVLGGGLAWHARRVTG